MIAPLLSRARAFAAADSGVAAVEMAFVAPVALILLSVIVASGMTLNAWRRTNAVAHTVTDLVSRTPNTTQDANIAGAEDLAQSDLLTDLGLSQLVIFPSDPSTLQITITEIQIDNVKNTGTVVWSQGYNGGTPTACATVFNLNGNIATAGATYMLATGVSYSFQPLGVVLNLPPMTLTSSELLTIRYAPQIVVTPVTDTTAFKQC